MGYKTSICWLIVLNTFSFTLADTWSYLLTVRKSQTQTISFQFCSNKRCCEFNSTFTLNAKITFPFFIVNTHSTDIWNQPIFFQFWFFERSLLAKVSLSKHPYWHLITIARIHSVCGLWQKKTKNVKWRVSTSHDRFWLQSGCKKYITDFATLILQK